MLRHLHWWVILHWLSTVTLWYYITLSAVIVEEKPQMEMQENDSKWANLSSCHPPNCICFPLWSTTDALIIWQRRIRSQLVAHIRRLPGDTSSEKAVAHSTLSKMQHTQQMQWEQNKTDGHGDSKTGTVWEMQRCTNQAEMQLFLPAEETWHSVPCKAGYRTLLSLQLLQTPLTNYHQHSKEKSGEKSHRFDRYCS